MLDVEALLAGYDTMQPTEGRPPPATADTAPHNPHTAMVSSHHDTTH